VAPSGTSFLAAGLIVGAASAGTKVIIALAGRLAPEEARGRIIGYLTCGVFLSILLARPSASLLTYYFSWHLAFLVPSTCDHCTIVTFPEHVLFTIVVLILALAICLLLLETDLRSSRCLRQ
jgi:predicted MFS family arabinose efflux permease